METDSCRKKSAKLVLYAATKRDVPEVWELPDKLDKLFKVQALTFLCMGFRLIMALFRSYATVVSNHKVMTSICIDLLTLLDQHRRFAAGNHCVLTHWPSCTDRRMAMWAILCSNWKEWTSFMKAYTIKVVAGIIIHQKINDALMRALRRSPRGWLHWFFDFDCIDNIDVLDLYFFFHKGHTYNLSNGQGHGWGLREIHGCLQLWVPSQPTNQPTDRSTRQVFSW